MADEKADAGALDVSHDKLEQQFQEVLQELVADKGLQRFRIEYEKLFRTLKKSHDNEKRLVKKCRELNAEIVANAAKVQTALKLSEEDQTTISALKKEIEKAWKMVDASHEKEARAKETISQLKLEIANLTSLVDQGDGLSLGEESTVNELLQQKEELIKELDQKTERIMRQEADISGMLDRLKMLEDEKVALVTKVNEQKELISAKKAEAEKEVRKRERIEKEVRDLKASVEQKSADIKQKLLQIQSSEEQQEFCRRADVEVQAKLANMLAEAKAGGERMQREYTALNERASKMHDELDDQIHQNAELLNMNGQQQLRLKAQSDEVATLKSEITRQTKLRDQAARKVKGLEEQRGELESSRDLLQADVAQLQKEVEFAHKQNEQERKRYEELTRERNILTKLKSQAESASTKQLDLIKISEGTKRNLEHEIRGFQTEAQRQQRQILQLEKERERFGQEASESTSKCMQAQEEVKLREMAIIDLQKKIGEAEAKFKQQQNLYEAVRVDRNMYSKKLIECQDEIQEMKRKFKMMTHQIEQLKDEISAKDMALVKEHFDHLRVEKEKEHVRAELNKASQQMKEADETISSQKAELDKLNDIVSEADQERIRQKKEYDIVINERDLLGTQLIRRNDELALLYEKIKIQQSTLSRGQAQYRDRVNEIRVLKIKLGDLKRELHILKSSVANIDVLKREVHKLGRELLRERTKVKALSEELENPLNVHRWRKLEGSDPSTFEMILKVQTLQKRLIVKTEEVVSKDLMIKEKEKLYVELKNILARQPGPEVVEQVSMYQANLRAKTKQMKAMASELNMYQAQVNEYKYEIGRLTQDMSDMKRQYFEQKRREQAEKMSAKDATLPLANPSVTRFTGGGFSLASTS